MRYLRLLVVAGAVTLVGLLAGCSDSTDGSASIRLAEQVCDADPKGCVEFGVGEPVELGALLWVGPTASGSGEGSRVAVELAIDYLDGSFDAVPGTLLGHPVDLIIDDDGCNPAAATAAALRLRQEPKLLAVVGTTCSAAALDAADAVLSEAGILLVSPSATAPALTDPDRRERFFFRTAPNDLIQGGVIADFVVRKLNTLGNDTASVAVVDDTSPYSSQLADVFSRQAQLAGVTVGAAPTLGSSRAAAGAVDVAVAVLEAAAPDLVFLPLFEPDCSQVVAQMRASTVLADVPIVVAEACVTTSFVDTLGDAADGVFGSAPDFSDPAGEPFNVDEFLPAFERRFGAPPPSVWHAHAFDAANLIFDATRRVAIRLPGGAFVVPRTALRNALLDVNRYRGVSGRLSCAPSGDCVPAARIAIYEAPQWPVQRGVEAVPVFSQSKSLTEVTGR